MAGQPPALDHEPDSATHLESRFEPRDQAAAARHAALRLARDARALPKDERWLYLRTLRSAARQQGLSGLAKVELEGSAIAERELGPTIGERELDGSTPLDSPVDRPAIEGDGFDLPRQGKEAPRQSLWISRRGLPAFALTGLLVGLAVAVMLPASLSERLPGTSGNDREPLAAQPSEPGGSGGPRESSGGSRDRSGGSASSAGPSDSSGNLRDSSGGSADPRVRQRERPSGRRAPAGRHLVGAGGVSGKGNGRIGTLRVDQPVRLRWSSGGGSFAIVSEAWRFRPRAGSGSTVLTPGTYRHLSVRSSGSWTLKLDPIG